MSDPASIEHKADYMLRSRAGSLKRATYMTMSKLGCEKGRPVKQYYARVRLHPEAPLDVREIPNGPVLTEHSCLAANAEVRRAA